MLFCLEKIIETTVGISDFEVKPGLVLIEIVVN